MIYLIIDILILLFVGFFSNRIEKLTFYNPFSWFLFFHFYMVTFRLIQLIIFNYPLLGFYNVPPTFEEIFYASILADLGLIFLFIGYLFAKVQLKQGNIVNYHRLTEKKIKIVCLFTFVIGLISMSQFLFVPFVQTGFTEPENKSLLFYANSWALYSFLLLIYFYGFKRKFLIPFLILLMIFAFQGESRFRLILPLIFLSALYLLRENKKWPSFKYIIISLVIFLFLFYPLKKIATIVQTGGDIEMVFDTVSTTFNASKEGGTGDFMFLDMYATVLTLVDESDKLYLGETYLSVFYMFIPRNLWAEKPVLTEWLYEISSVDKPIGEFGQTPSLFGESFANFRLFGVIGIPFLYSFFMTKFYFRIKRINPLEKSAELLLYLIFLSVIIQVYRDGLISLVLFPFINFFPITILGIYFIFFTKRNYEFN